MGAEDFAFFVMTDEKVPGAYFSVGGTPQADLDAEAAGGPAVPSHHSPFFKIDPKPSVTMGTRGHDRGGARASRHELNHSRIRTRSDSAYITERAHV